MIYNDNKLKADKGGDHMKCPCCGKEMINGVVQSARQIFFTTKAHKFWFAPDANRNDEVLLCPDTWIAPTSCTAYHCPDCKKVVIDYSADTE